MTPLLLSVDEAAKALSLSRRGVYRLLESREIEAVRIGQRRLVPAEALEDYVYRLRTQQSA